jgi:cell fate (sporulation/competence/biofilm development) regulator YlbF (YheA/YmcA/DUF963 family)
VNDILARATELGKAIAASDRFAAVQAIRKGIDADEALQADLKAAREQAEKIATLEQEGKPVEPEDKRLLRDLQMKVTTSDKMQKRARAEADFAELMNRVHGAIRGELRE